MSRIGKILKDQRGHVMGAARAPIVEGNLRKDAWWVLPLVIVIYLGAFIVYSTWAALQNGHYHWGPYLSPFYSPCLSVSCAEHTTLGWGLAEIRLPIIGILSPAFLILWGPGLFRLSCYYYRKAYYRSFWLSPPACAVPDGHRTYTGETRFPLVLQAFHRYTWYVAVLFIVALTWDAILAFRFPVEGGGHAFGIGVGTIIMWINVILLALYTFSCHSCRHVCGGHVDVFSKAKTRYSLWHAITAINERHPLFAWLSLSSVGLTDLYIRLVSLGVIHDFRII